MDNARRCPCPVGKAEPGARALPGSSRQPRGSSFRIAPRSGTLSRPMASPRVTTALALAALAACAPGCARKQPAEQIAAAPLAVGHDDVITPVVRGGTNGLEVLWFVSPAERNDPARA